MTRSYNVLNETSGVTGKEVGRMTFSQKVKDELARAPLPERQEAVQAELLGFWHVLGTFFVRENQPYLHFETGHSGTARRIFNLWRQLTSIRPELMMRREHRLKQQLRFLTRVRFQEESERALGLEKGSLKSDLVAKFRETVGDSRRAHQGFLRAAFLGRGSITHPRSGYHLEIRCGGKAVAELIQEVLRQANISSRVLVDQWDAHVYLKGAETIADFLKRVGALEALFVLEDIRIIREVRNRVNRLVNSETANMSKTLRAAVQQLEDVRRLSPEGMAKLSPRTREIIALRLDQPEASLRELGLMLEPPLTKSSVEYHFRKIRDLVGRDM